VPSAYSRGNKFFGREVSSRRGTGLEPSALARFEAVVLPHLDAAYTLARYLTRNAHDAEDVAQEACLRALKYFDGFRGEEAPSARAWLLTIVRNTAHTWGKRHRFDALTAEFDETQHSEAVEDRDPEAKETLGRALDRLAPEFREVIVLRELQGLSYKEISDVAGVPVGTVMSRLSRARARLQEALREEEVR
jgi:RNA polymerase sigma-70 factor, ECF subfamily